MRLVFARPGLNLAAFAVAVTLGACTPDEPDKAGADDTAAPVHPGATEIPHDAIDQECDGDVGCGEG